MLSEMLCTDDLVLVCETIEELSNRFIIWMVLF